MPGFKRPKFGLIVGRFKTFFNQHISFDFFLGFLRGPGICLGGIAGRSGASLALLFVLAQPLGRVESPATT